MGHWGLDILLLSFLALLLEAGMTLTANAQTPFAEDTIPTAAGPLTIGLVGHGTLMFRFAGKVIHVDPVGREADYDKLPKADLILVTHEHGDHLDPKAIAAIRTSDTRIVVSRSCAGKLEGAVVMANGETRTEAGLLIEAVPAYNVVHHRPDGQPYHPKGAGNGYVITFGDKRVYIAGDTENTPEMKALEGIDVAFLPMNLPYTMTPAMVADAAKAFRPRILYPYHYGNTDPNELVKLLAGQPGIEVRIRDMQ
jgi:L-ascorbate metabolism protein UlaG (beta-lactamase superfamily)